MRLFSIELLEPRFLMAALPIISEFMASNRDTLRDGYGNSSDWIEIHNAGNAGLNLAGYHLTDDVNDRTKWRFPAHELGPGEFLTVFASGQNGLDPRGMPHTNFRLDSDGEYLALIEPDGRTIVSQFNYPEQRTDIAYGPQQESRFTKLVDEESPSKLLVPTGETPASIGNWKSSQPPFDDSRWTNGQASVGFGPGAGNSNDNIAVGATVTASGPLWPGFAASRLTDGRRTTISHPRDPVTTFEFLIKLEQESEFDRIQIVNRADGCCPERLTNYRVTIHDDDEGSPGPAVWSADIRTDGTNSGVAGVDILRGDLDPDGDFAGQYLAISRIDTGDLDYWPQIAEVEVYASAGYDSLIRTNVESVMLNNNATVLQRIPFEVSSVDAIQELVLNMNYDDGFVAYVNGTEVARRNAPDGELPFRSQATRSHVGTSAEAIRVPTSMLRTGENMLAIHGLNQAVSDIDFLILPTLVGRSVTTGAVGYLLDPTPSAYNTSSVEGFVADPVFSVQRGFFTTPFQLTVQSNTPGASLIYTTDGSTPTAINGTIVAAVDAVSPPIATVPVNTTSLFRAVALKPGLARSAVETQTYLFLDDVIRQPANPQGMPARWAGTAADYEMDPDVVDDPAYRDEIIDGLRSIPTISLVTNHEHLWDERDGIYVHSTQRGSQWERPVSIELIKPDGSTGFQVDAGLRMWGTGWASHDASKKHAFQLKFKPSYGPSKLEYPLFPDAPVERFDDIILRAQGSRSWFDFRRPDINQSQYIRDAYARDTARDMGKLEGHATFVHLYLNGLYWGLYNPVERTNEQFGEEYLGGNTDEYDVINKRSGQATIATAGNMIAWNAMMDIADAGLQSPEAYQAIQKYLNIDDFIDYMLLQQYGTNHDGPDQGGNNMRALRRRNEDGRFTFHVWDMEYTLWYQDEHRNIDGDVEDSPMRLFHRLRQNPEFALRFADRVRMHMFDGGALTPEKAIARYQERVDELFTAIIGESARWGDGRRARPFTRDVEWVAERDRLLNEYFPARSEILLRQLRDGGLYPSIDAPQFSQPGGRFPVGYAVDIEAGEGTVFYTLDGTDPRLPHGQISPRASTFVPTTRLVAPGAAVQVWLPRDDSLGTSWTGSVPNFDTRQWSAGTAPVGFDDNPQVAPQPVPLHNATATFSQTGRSIGQTIDGILTGRGWGLSQPVDFQGPVIRAATAVYETVSDVSFPAGTELTFTLIHDSTARANLGRFRISVTTDPREQFADGRESGGDVTANWTPLRPTEAISAEGATFTFRPDDSIFVSGGTNSRDTYTIKAVTPVQGITGFRLETINDSALPGRAGPGRHSSGNAELSEFVVAAAPATLDHVFASQMTNPLPSDTVGERTSVYLRIPFRWDGPAAFDRLRLRLRYNDGFVAYLNGQEIARAGVNGVPRFDAVATTDRPQAKTLTYSEFEISNGISHLQIGENVLAIHALDAVSVGPAFLIQPELMGERDLNHAIRSNTEFRARILAGELWSALTVANFQPVGDLTTDGRVDGADLQQLCVGIRARDPATDVTGDGITDYTDLSFMVTHFLGSTFGDSNLDRVFNSSDLVQVFQAGEYEDAALGNSSWADGDWNCDGDFSSADLITAFQAGGFSPSAIRADISAPRSWAFEDVTDATEKPMSGTRTRNGNVEQPASGWKAVQPRSLDLAARDLLFRLPDREWNLPLGRTAPGFGSADDEPALHLDGANHYSQ
jgi:hypothetical protein